MKPAYSNPACALSFLVFALLDGPASAGEAGTAWVETFKSKVRLISVGNQQIDGKDMLLAGIHVKMAPGWKTYWRVPGDSGLPPSFGWKGSSNLKQARVMWPGPQRFEDSAGTSVGYHDEVVFPVAVTPAMMDKPVTLTLDFEFAICKDICAPANVQLALEMEMGDDGEAADVALVKSYLDEVPRKASDGAGGPAITAMTVELAEPEPHITVDAKYPSDSEWNDLFIEGPSAVFIPLPERVSSLPDGGVRYRVDLRKGGDPLELKGQILTITLISPGESREVTHRVD